MLPEMSVSSLFSVGICWTLSQSTVPSLALNVLVLHPLFTLVPAKSCVEVPSLIMLQWFHMFQDYYIVSISLLLS